MPEGVTYHIPHLGDAQAIQDEYGGYMKGRRFLDLED
jgi:hypothetical protein